jgi:hypothetical protein
LVAGLFGYYWSLLKPHETNRGYDSQDEINSIVERFARLAAVIRDANPADNAEIYKGTQPGADLPA